MIICPASGCRYFSSLQIEVDSQNYARLESEVTDLQSAYLQGEEGEVPELMRKLVGITEQLDPSPNRYGYRYVGQESRTDFIKSPEFAVQLQEQLGLGTDVLYPVSMGGVSTGIEFDTVYDIKVESAERPMADGGDGTWNPSNKGVLNRGASEELPRARP